MKHSPTWLFGRPAGPGHTATSFGRAALTPSSTVFTPAITAPAVAFTFAASSDLHGRPLAAGAHHFTDGRCGGSSSVDHELLLRPERRSHGRGGAGREHERRRDLLDVLTLDDELALSDHLRL